MHICSIAFYSIYFFVNITKLGTTVNLNSLLFGRTDRDTYGTCVKAYKAHFFLNTSAPKSLPGSPFFTPWKKRVTAGEVTSLHGLQGVFLMYKYGSRSV